LALAAALEVAFCRKEVQPFRQTWQCSFKENTMPFDPFGLREYHENVTRRIRDKEPGLAQSWIGDSLGGALVSLEAGRLAGGPTHANVTEVMDELMLDVARGEGAATSGAFSLKRIELMIENRERWYDPWGKGKAEAALLSQLRASQPELFY
jgi:hypothetical protein